MALSFDPMPILISACRGKGVAPRGDMQLHNVGGTVSAVAQVVRDCWRLMEGE